MIVGLGAEETAALRDRIEADILAPAVARGFRRFLARLERAALRAIDGPRGALTASADPMPGPWDMGPVGANLGAVAGTASDDLFTLGAALGWWAEEVGPEVAQAVSAAMNLALVSRQGVVVVSGVEGVGDYLTRVTDRLVYGRAVHGVTAPSDAFDAVRVAVADSTVLGWSRPELARRISVELDWASPDHNYWSNVHSSTGGLLDDILDQYGPPGTPAREYARATDPRVEALQRERSKARLRLDADQSVWESRATMIARTESTGVNNYAALHALAEEGAVGKEWLSAHDDRTRPEHIEADGQAVALAQPFDIGGVHLQFPGDPSGPAHLTINCRCSIVGLDELPGGSVQVSPETTAPPSYGDMSEDALDAAMEEAIVSGDFDAAARIEEELSGRFYTGDGSRVRPDDPMGDGTFEWFNAQDSDTQNRFLDAMGDNQTGPFLEASWAFENSGRRVPSVLPPERQIRKEYDDWLDNEWVRAEEAAEGYMLSAEARARGIHPRELWKVNEATARSWASPEMLAYWDENGRTMYADFKAGYTGAEQAAAKLRGTWS